MGKNSPQSNLDNRLDVNRSDVPYSVLCGGFHIEVFGNTKFDFEGKYTILEYMLRNQGIVLTRDRIEQNIFNYEYEGASNMVDVYIRYLRKKLDDGFEPKLIHTVRGTGYVMRVNA